MQPKWLIILFITRYNIRKTKAKAAKLVRWNSHSGRASDERDDNSSVIKFATKITEPNILSSRRERSLPVPVQSPLACQSCNRLSNYPGLQPCPHPITYNGINLLAKQIVK